LKRLEGRQTQGDYGNRTKKEELIIGRKILRLQDRLGGIRAMVKLPDLLFIVDVRREETAVKEANSLGVPVVALVDTNCDPSGVDYVIPANDDAIRAIKLMTGKLADAVLEGKALRKDERELAEASALDGAAETAEAKAALDDLEDAGKGADSAGDEA